MAQKYTGLQRESTDKFYTKDHVAKMCCDLFNENIDVRDNDRVIEPSAGAGVFIPYIESMNGVHLYYDIDPSHNSIEKRDFMTIEKTWNNNTHIIGNPPFGRQSSLARRFIKHCCSIGASTIAFILPKSFRKPSYQNAFHVNYHNICDIDLPESSFTIYKKDYSVSCVFQIWVKMNYPRVKPGNIEPKNFYFVKRNQDPEYSIRRVGVNAGKIDQNCEKSVQSHYFIRFFDLPTCKKETVVKDLENCVFTECRDTVGPKSISKPELIAKINGFVERLQ